MGRKKVALAEETSANGVPFEVHPGAYFRDLAKNLVMKPKEEFEICRRIEVGYQTLVAGICQYIQPRPPHSDLPYKIGLHALGRMVKREGLVNISGGFSQLEKEIKQTHKQRMNNARQKKLDNYHGQMFRLIESGTADWKPFLRDVKEDVFELTEGNAHTKAGRVYRSKILRSYQSICDGEHNLIKGNLRLVVSIARRYNKGRLPLTDVIQDGNIGLLKAVDRFDYHKGYRFSTYASWWIRHAIVRSIADTSRTVRIPVHILDAGNKLNGVSRTLTHKLGRKPTEDELSKASGFTLDKIRKIHSCPRETLSLDRKISKEDDRNFVELLCDKDAVLQDESYAEQIIWDKVEDTMDDLTSQEADILRKRFGLKNGTGPPKEYTLKEIGAYYGLSRERIRQLQERALGKIRKALCEKDLL
tara:strand:- start:1440 stop:2690 length:1251 start_codon:yes stop_codon:yes gene_type:complete